MEKNEIDEIKDSLIKIEEKLKKDKSTMKTLLLRPSNDYFKKVRNNETANLFISLLATLYFIPSTIQLADNAMFFWSGVIASGLWIYQLIYSFIGYTKIETINHDKESIAVTLEKVISLKHFYTRQMWIYIYLATLTISASIWIPIYHMAGAGIYDAMNMNWYQNFIIVFLAVGTLLAIVGTRKYWNSKFIEPLEDAEKALLELKA